MRDDVLYHNPRCSKSRAALAWVQEADLPVTVVPYLDEPPTAAQVLEICKVLGKAPLEIMRTKEKRFSELGLSTKDDRPDGEWAELIATNPILLERPILVRQGKAAIGRPLENIQALA